MYPFDFEADSEDGRFRFPTAPRLLLGPYTILPFVDRRNRPVLGQWVLPGERVISTADARQIAERNGWQFHIIN